MGAAAMAASLAMGAAVTARPAAAAAQAANPPLDPPPPAALSVEATLPADTTAAGTLHGLPPEVFAARIETLAGLLAGR